MADLKFRTGASATVTKEKSLEEKLAGIIGTSTGAIKSLETQLRRDREAEEARKKAEEEARKRAEAAQAAAASAASAQAAKRAEGERQATIRALKQRLAANLKSPDATVGSAPAAPAAQMVSLGQEEEEARITQARAIKTQAAAGLNKTPDNALREAFGTAEAEQESTVRREPNDLDRMLDAGDKEGLAYAAQRAASQAKVADEALEKNERYLADMREKVETLERQIGAIRSKSRRTDEENEQLQALSREYKLYKPLYDKAQDINKRRTQQDEYAKAWNEAAQTYAYLGDAEGRYSDERGVLLQENARQLEEIWLYGGTPEYISNNYAMLSELAASVGMDLESYVADMQENGKNYVRTAKAEYAAWYQGKIEHDIMVTLFTLPEADEEMFRKIVAFYDTDTTTTDLFGNSAYAKQTDNARSYERTLQAKYGEDYERILDRVTRLVNSERREQQLAAFKSASGLEKAALSVFSVATNFVSSPGVLFEYALQSAQAADRDYYSPIDTNERGFAMQNFTQGVRGATAETLEEKYGAVGSFLYNTAMSGIDSYVTGNIMGTAGAVVLGATAATNTMQDITQRGGSVEQAILGGIAAGVFETLFERVSIGGMQAMEKTAFSAKSLGEMFSRKTLKTYVGNIAKETGINFTEEAMTEIANIVYDIAVLGDISNYQLRIDELMKGDPNLTQAQAKKIVATELALQVAEAGLSGALMGSVFGAMDTTYAALGHLSNLRTLETANVLAAKLPADMRPAFESGKITSESVEEYARAVYDKMVEYNAQRAKQRKAATAENAQDGQKTVDEKAGVTVNSLSTAQQVYDAIQDGREAAREELGAQEGSVTAQAEAEAYAAREGVQQAAVTPQTVENAQDVSSVGAAQKAPVSFDTDDVSDFVREEAQDIWNSLSIYEGQMRYEAMMDEANALRMEGRAELADELEKIYRESENGGTEYGDSLSQRRERDAGESAGGEARAVAESAGRDQSRNVQAGRSAGRRAAAQASGAEKVSVRSLGLRGGTTGATVYDITDTTQDPELVNIQNDAKLAGADLRFVVGKLTFTNGVTAAGIYDNGAIVVAADDEVFQATQLANHELYHWIHAKTPGVTERLIERLKQEFSESEMDALIEAYTQLYAGTGATADMILEEICADMYAGMVREQFAAARRANLPQFTGEARRMVRERANVDALGESGANGTRAGPEKTKTAAGSDAGDGRYSINDNYVDEINEWYEDGMPDGEMFILGSTGATLQGLGAIESDIYILGDKIKTIFAEHPEMTIEEIKRIPEILEDPALVLGSRNANRGDRENTRLVLFNTIKAQNGKPIMVVLNLRPLDKNKILIDDLQQVSSAYTKETEPVFFVKNSQILHADKNRSIAVLRNIGFQMPISLLRDGSVGSISYTGRHVNINGVRFNSVFSETPTSNRKSRFSMSSPVEQTDTLIALHNMDEEKLRRTLDLGAWPSPSIAIVEAEQGHTNYGEYSAVFPRSTIDPEEDSRNRVYGSDAWTPTHSNARVEYEVNYDVLRTFERDVESLAKQIADGVFSTSSVLRMMGVEDQTEYDLDEIAKRLADKDAVKAAYLADHGEDVEIVYRKKTFDNFGNEALRSYVEKVGVQEAARLAAKMMTGERLSDAEVETAKDVIMEHWIASHERALNAKPELRERRVANQREKLSDIRAEDFIRHAWDFYEDSGAGTDEIDRMATSNNLADAVDTQDVQAWAKEMLDGLLGEPGIYNGREFYDSRGNRRSFRDTHWEYSVENIVRAMNNADGRGANMFGMGASGLIATATPEYGSVSQIHAEESRLRTVDKEEYDQIVENLNTTLDRVVKDIMRSTEHHADNTFEEMEIIETVIAQAAQGKRTMSAIKRVFAREGYAISDPQARAVLDLLKEVAKVPTGYFEAKPQRVVSFEEAIAVVAPDNANKELLKEMRAAGMNVETYKAGDENDRLAVINGLNGARFSISDDTTEQLQTRLDEVEKQIAESDALLGDTGDSTLFGQLEELRVERAAIYGELDDRLRREARRAAREEDEKRAAQLEQIRLVEDHAKELSREANAERAAYKADGNADHLVNAERLRSEAAAERKKGARLRKEAGLDGKPKYRPVESMRTTSSRILDLFRIQAGSRAEMRAGINTILNRTLTQGYVTESDLESLLRTMYEAGVDVVQPDAAYEDVAKTVRGTTLYISEEVRREFGDDWREMQRALTRAGIKTSLNIGERGIDSLYGELAEGYPGLFDSEQTDMRAMLEDLQEAAKLGKATHRSLAESATAIGLSSDEDFAALYNEVSAELRSFADRAGLEVQLRENLLRETNERNAERLQAERERGKQRLANMRQHYVDIARRASERRQRSEQMTKIRNVLKRLNRAAERNSETLNKVISQQSPELQQLAQRAMDELDTVANRLTDKKRISLLELQQAYEDMKADNPNFIPNPATEKALARVGMVHLNDMSVEDLQALYDAVTRIEHDFDKANELIGEGMDQQLDNAGMALQEEIEYAEGSDAEGNFAYWMNEASLSPSRALLRMVGYDRSGIMGQLVESFENGDIDVMGYTLGADMIFDAFMKRDDVRKWLKTAAGKNAEMVEIEVPKILEWGEGDTPIFDQKDGHIITEKVYASPMMLVQMARDLKNEQNMWHVKYGGYTFPDAELYKKGKTQEAYARTTARAIRMSPQFVQQVVEEHLGEIGKEYVKLLDQYYDVFSKTNINRVSQRLDGVDKAIADSYNPVRTDKAYLGKAYNVLDGTIEGMGSLKNRQQYAGTPMILDDADATYRWHRDNMARYVGYAVPMRNFKLLMNYQSAHRSETTRALIEQKFGANAGKFLDDFAKVVEEGKLPQGKGFDFLDKITGKYVARVLGFNISSMLKQVSALATAATSYGPGAVAKGLITTRKADINLIRKYTPYYDYRGAGNTYVEVAAFVRNTDNAQQSKLIQWLLGKNWLSEMDLLIHRRLWFAAEHIVRKRGLEPGTEAEIQSGNDPFYNAVAVVFNRMTHDTQTNYNLMSRPMVLRNNNPVVRMAAMFKTDAFQLQGIVREQYGAWQTAKRKFEDGKIDSKTYAQAKQRMIYGVVGYTMSSLMSAMLEAFAKWVRGDDDDYRDENGKWTLGTAGREIAKDFLYNMVGCVLFGDQVADLISAAVTDERLWEPDIPSVSSLYDMYESIMNLTEQIGELLGTAVTLRGQGDTAKEYWKNNADVLFGFVRKLLYQVGTFTGTPVQNMEKSVLGVIDRAFPQIGVAYDDLFADFTKSDLATAQGEELTASLHAYLTDEVGDLGEAAEAEILRLYELYGNKALPGANAPSKVKDVDEDGNEIERAPTLAELGNWDAEYRRKMMDSLGELIGSEFYNSLSDEEKLKLISRANEYARNTAKEYAGMPVDYEKWMENVSSAIDAGTDLASALYFYTKASVLEADKDENGEAISGSLALKELALLDSMDTSGAAKRDLLEGVLSPAQLENLDMLLNAGYDVDGAVNMIRTSLETRKSLKSFTKYLDQGFDREAAQELYEAIAALEPEEGKDEVSDVQKYEAILASGLSDAEKWTAFGTVMGTEMETDEGNPSQYAKMLEIKNTGATVKDYLDIRKMDKVDNYLKAIESGLSAGNAKKMMEAVASMPKLPKGESYDTRDRQLAACKAMSNAKDKVLAFATYEDAADFDVTVAKFTAAAEYGVTPELYIAYKDALFLADVDADANGTYTQEEAKAALAGMNLTREQKAVLYQLTSMGWKYYKNPYSSTAAKAVYDAYLPYAEERKAKEEAARREKAEKMTRK